MRSATSSPPADPAAPSERAFAFAARLRASDDRRERAAGDFVAHGLMCALTAETPVASARWVSDRLPHLAEALARLAGALQHGTRRDEPLADQLVADLLRNRSARDRWAWRRLAVSALRDEDFMVALSAGDRALPTPVEIDDAIDAAFASAPH